MAQPPGVDISVIRRLIWLLVAAMALGVIALLISTPTPLKDGGWISQSFPSLFADN